MINSRRRKREGNVFSVVTSGGTLNRTGTCLARRAGGQTSAHQVQFRTTDDERAVDERAMMRDSLSLSFCVFFKSI